jgi:DNA repair protein RecN (Recombination protein N)
MLTNLHIENIAVIRDAQIEFGNGFNILTGETGAGKSIIIDAINLILGGRTSKSIIRYGERSASCEALFSVGENNEIRSITEEAGIRWEEDGLVVARTVSEDGRSVCRVNGRIVAASVLKALSPHLIHIHGQHDNETLLYESSHLRLLDSYAREETGSVLEEYRSCYEELKGIRARLKALSVSESEKEYRADLLRHQIKEITKARLSVGEEEALAEKIKNMENFESLSKNIEAAYALLYAEDQSAADSIAASVKHLGEIMGAGREYEELYTRLLNVQYELTDIAESVGRSRDSLEFDPDRLAKYQARAQLLRTMTRKYNTDIAGILEHLQKAQAELEQIESSAEQITKLQKELEEKKNQLTKIAVKLSALRKNAAAVLQKQIETELLELNMPKAKFVISVQLHDKFTEMGVDRVEFLISTNAGAPPAPLSKIASGGELSRVMLAIKTVLSREEDADTMIFDEIDTGVSGDTARKIAEKMARISRHKQVLCITHLAQLASMADSHYLIEKKFTEQETLTSVRLLEEEERVRELAAIMSGMGESGEAQAHARRLIEAAKEYKGALK